MNSFFMSLAGDIFRLPGAKWVVMLVGFAGFFVIVSLMPIRLIWTIWCYLKHKNVDVTDRCSLYVSNVFLVLSAYATFDFMYFFLNARAGDASGLMAPIFSFVPFIFYILFEIFRARAHRVVKND